MVGFREQRTADNIQVVSLTHALQVRPTTAHRTALATAAYMRHVEQNKMLVIPVNITKVQAPKVTPSG